MPRLGFLVIPGPLNYLSIFSGFNRRKPFHRFYQGVGKLSVDAQDFSGLACNKVAEGLGLDETPTLSVGIAIVHIHENLRTALEFARSAERAAKNGGRNQVQVSLAAA